MHEYTSVVRIWELTCPGFLEEVGRVRRWIRDVLSDSPRVDDAALIVTELSTNALLHSDSGNSSRAFFSITLTRAPDLITISVTDFGGSSSPAAHPAPQYQGSARPGPGPGRSPCRAPGGTRRRHGTATSSSPPCTTESPPIPTRQQRLPRHPPNTSPAETPQPRKEQTHVRK